MTEPALRRGKIPTAVVFLGFTSLFTDIGGEMIFPLLPVFLASVGAAPAFLGLVEGVAEATAAFLKLGSGYLADRLPGKKPLVLFGYGLATLVRPLVAIATAPWHVLVVRVTDRVGKGIRATPRDALIANAAGEGDSGRAFGFHEAMDHTGAVIGPLLATLLLGVGLTMRHVFWVAFIPGILAVLCVVALKEPPAPPAKSATQAAADAKVKLPAALRSYLVILGVFSLGNSSDAFLLLRAKEVGVPVVLIPAIWAAFHVVKVISAWFFGKWSDKVPRVAVIIAGWAVYAGSYLAFGLANQAWEIWALFGVYGTYYGMTAPAEKALMKDLAPAAIRGRAYGYYNFILGAAAIPAGLLTGYLWQTLSPLVALAVGAGLAGVSSAALLVWATARRNLPPAANVQTP